MQDDPGVPFIAFHRPRVSPWKLGMWIGKRKIRTVYRDPEEIESTGQNGYRGRTHPGRNKSAKGEKNQGSLSCSRMLSQLSVYLDDSDASIFPPAAAEVDVSRYVTSRACRIGCFAATLKSKSPRSETPTILILRTVFVFVMPRVFVMEARGFLVYEVCD